MMSCSICHKATLEEQLTEIGLGSNVYQCEECWTTIGGEPLKKECPNHQGSFDCNAFCRICEGEQEYQSNGFLPCKRFEYCGTQVKEDIWNEELGFCQPCSDLYFDHKLDPYTLERVTE